MNRLSDLLLTSLAPIIWGSSYIVTTQMLPNMDPVSIAVLRALPAGLLMLVWVRQLPSGLWIPRMFVLGALNFSIFWGCLFFSAYRLPGGVAAILGALQPLIVIFAARAFLGHAVRPVALIAVLAGVGGIALLLLTPKASLDGWGVTAGLLGAASMAVGTVLSRKWQPPVSALTFTAWQLTAGGILLLPFLPLASTDWATLSSINILGLIYLSLIGAGLTYMIWFRGIARLQPSSVSVLGFLSPLSASILGWLILNETLGSLQLLGAIIALASVFLAQYALRPKSQHA